MMPAWPEVPTNDRHARQLRIVHILRSREWVSATSLANRFGVSQRTIYRDIEQLIAYGIPVEAIPGKDGGYRLGTADLIDSLSLASEDLFRLYVLGLLNEHPEFVSLSTGILQAHDFRPHMRDLIRKISERIYLDPSDWYWKDEGSEHLPTLRHAILTNTAIEICVRVMHRGPVDTAVVKPYGMVWKGGEWYLVAAPMHAAPRRYSLRLIDRLTETDLRFKYPDASEFRLRDWWSEHLVAYGRGPNRVVIHVADTAREELLRLGLKPDSEVRHNADGSLTIVLFVDRWQWLIPLVTSYGEEVVIEEPPELRKAIETHLRAALRQYDPELPSTNGTATGATRFRNDDSRLRSTRARAPRDQ